MTEFGESKVKRTLVLVIRTAAVVITIAAVPVKQLVIVTGYLIFEQSGLKKYFRGY